MTDKTTEVEQTELEQFTPEELAEAKQELASLTPVDYLAMRAYIDSLEESAGLPEAPAIIFTELMSPRTGAALNLTVRAHDPIIAINRISQAMKFARERFGLLPVPKHPISKSQPAAAQPAAVQPPALPTSNAANTSVPAPAPAHAPAHAPAPARQEPVYESEVPSGTSVINKIVVMEKKVQFHVGKFKYPFTDSRKPEVIAALFDSELGWTPEHFSVDVAIYTPDQFGELYADWEKPQKYYNVTRVHR